MSSTCSCGSQCPTHGIISLDDRQAAWTAGHRQGCIDMQLHLLKHEAQALSLASDLIEWVATRIHARAEHGPSWAAEVAGDMPEVTR